MNCINSTTINQRYLNEIENFRLFDDDFMSKVFGFRPEETEFLLQKILKKDDLKVIESIPEYSIKNLQGKSIRLDIKAIDSENRLYDIEIQRANEGSVPQRARYYSGLIDSNIMDKGDVPWGDLPECFVIFITEKDTLKGNKPIYHVERMIIETDELFNDKEHIVYVNGAYESNDDLGKLMHDFKCKNPDDMYYEILKNRTKYFKETMEGKRDMCEAMERLKNEGRAEGIVEGRIEGINEGIVQGKEAMVYNLLDLLDDETLSQASGLPIEKVKKIRKARKKKFM